jgi:hypothetical protein
MTAVCVDDAILSNMAQPQMKRHIGLLQIISQSPARFEHDILHDVAGIHSALYLVIQPQLNQPMDGLPMSLQQPIHGIGITGLRFAQKLRCLLWFRPHGELVARYQFSVISELSVALTDN